MSKIISSPALRAVKDKRSGVIQARSCTAVVGNSSLVAPNVKTRAYKNQVKAALSSASAGSAPNSAVNKPAPASQDAVKAAAPEVRIVADDHGLRVVGADVDTARSSSLSPSASNDEAQNQTGASATAEATAANLTAAAGSAAVAADAAAATVGAEAGSDCVESAACAESTGVERANADAGAGAESAAVVAVPEQLAVAASVAADKSSTVRAGAPVSRKGSSARIESDDAQFHSDLHTDRALSGADRDLSGADWDLKGADRVACEAAFDVNATGAELNLVKPGADRSAAVVKAAARAAVVTATVAGKAGKVTASAASQAGQVTARVAAKAAAAASNVAVKAAQKAASSAPVKKLAQRTFFAQIVHTLSLFLPLFMGQLAATSMGVVDTVMAGAAGTLELSGVAIGSSIFWPSELFVVGMALAIHPLIANLAGNGELHKVALRMQIATVCCVALAVIIGIIIMLVPLVYRMFPGVDQDMVSIGQWYLVAVGLAMPGFAMFNVLRAYWEGLGKTGPTLMFGCMALILNIPLNYIFIFGHLGMPALGGVGCGVATALSIYLTVVGMLYYVRKSPTFARVRIYTRWEPVTFSQCLAFLKLALPLGIAGMIETLCFSLVAIMLSPFGPVVVASHTIAMNVSGLLAIVPIALSSTASIEVGEAMGTSSWSHARKRALSSTSLAVAFYVIGASVLFFMGEQIAALYSDDAEVLLLAPVLMMYCVVFFFPETLQVMAIGILRGFKDSRTIFLVTVVAYWIVGMPVGYSLGYGYLGDALEGAEGFWLGFIFSLSCASILLGGRLLYLFIKEKNPDTTARSF